MIFKRFKKRKSKQEAITEAKQIIMQLEYKIAELEKRIQAYEALEQNEVLADIQQLFLRQTEKGVSKYGAPVKVDNLDTIQWIQHALEECADMMVYLSSFKKKLERGETYFD